MRVVETDKTEVQGNKRRSENRRMQKRIIFRVSDEEYALFQAAAGDAGLTVGSYIRERLLIAPQTRKRRGLRVDVQAVTRLQGAMNKVGSNIHQILKRVNFGETPEGAEYRDALQGYREVIAAILAALGRT